MTTTLSPAQLEPAQPAVELGVSHGWERRADDQRAIFALDHFGASAPASAIPHGFC